MNQKQFRTAAEHVEDAPEAPAPAPQGNADRLLARIRTQRPDLATRPNFVILHQRGCPSANGLLCTCDATCAVGGSVLRLRD